MKNEIRLALLCMAATAAPAMAQSTPQCGSSNYDQSRNSYTIMNPASGAVNQQCFITVYPTGATPALARQHPASYLIEGSYAIELSGGGGGGGAGAQKDKGGGGGGAGAAPSRTNRFLAPGEYKLTIGTGGAGGIAGGSSSLNGNPTSIVRASTGQLIAGFAGADGATATSSSATSGRGGMGAAGGSTGGGGGDSGMKSEAPAQAGGMSASTGTSMPGQAGSESGRTARTSDGRAAQANAGGGGGAGVGVGGDGASANIAGASQGRQGGGGGGGSGAVRFAGPGATGGNGFIRLALTALAPQPVAAAPAATAVAAAPLIQKYSMSSDALFGFGKATLRPEGKAKLNELVSRLKTVDIDTILSTGHSDRIGASEPNQRLSMERAETVKSYLISQGVQSYRNAAVGMGEYQPMTNANDCKGPTSPKVIACLQPDRRVDVEIVVSKKI
jgi:OOP family OmpA-OmpF porin